MESRGEIQDELFTYMKNALDAVDIKYGASHGEVIMCHDGPCLVEVGARMHGRVPRRGERGECDGLAWDR